MKCEKCNAKVGKEDVFCPECGSNLKRKDKNIFNEICEKLYFHRKIIYIVIISLFSIFILLNVMSYLFSPKYLADKYIKAVLNNDYEKIYELIDLEDSDLISINMLKEKITKTDIDEYKYDGIQCEGDSTLVRYIYTSNNQKNTIYVKLTKQLNKKLLIFDNYKIVSGKIATNVSFGVPKDSTVKLDDIDISSYLDNKSSSNSYDVYTFDELIIGSYDIQITLPNGMVISDEITPESNKNYSINNVKIDDTFKETLINDLTQTLNTIYTGAINNTDYSTIGLNNLLDEYKTIKSYIQTNSIKLTSITFTDIDTTKATYSDNLVVTFNIGCNYNTSYTNNNETKTYNGIGYIDITVEYTYNDGKYTIENISNLPTSFKIR